MYSLLTFSDQSTPREILKEFYRNYNLGEDGGIGDPYVKIELYKNLAIYFPNFNERKKAVLKHDIHHLATGYTSVLKGETEISAWELSSGCFNYLAAFLINMHGMMMGVPFNITGIFKAFKKGRRTKNLYKSNFSNEELLDMKVSEIRKLLLLDTYSENAKTTFMDVFLFLSFLLLGSVYSVLSLIFLPVIVFSTIYVLIFPHKLKPLTSKLA